jgi:hypothetical protein
MHLAFFDKEYILILQRYQLHLASATTQCPNGIMYAHSPKTKERRKKKAKSRYSDLFLVAAAQPPPRQYLKSKFSKKRRLQEGNSAQTPLLSDHRSQVFILEKARTPKIMPSTRSLPNTTN